MSLFKKAPVKVEPVVNFEPSFSYPIQVKFWNVHRDGLCQLLKSIDLNINDMENGRMSSYLKCKIVPEPDNKTDRNALKVCASHKSAKSKEFFDIGYIPSEFTAEVKKDNKKVEAKTHFWSLRMTIDIINGIDFNLYLKESKF